MDPKKLINSMDDQCIAIAMVVVTLRDAIEQGSVVNEFKEYAGEIEKLEKLIITYAREPKQIEAIGSDNLEKPRKELREKIEEVVITLKEQAGKDHFLTSALSTLNRFSRALKKIDGIESSDEEDDDLEEVHTFNPETDLPGSPLPKRLRLSPDPYRTHSSSYSGLTEGLKKMTLTEKPEPMPAPPTKSKPPTL